MKIMSFAKTLFLTVSVLTLAVVATAQEPTDVRTQDTVPTNAKEPRRPNLLAQLGLERNQIQQIRRLNTERRPLMEAAQRRFREANQALDEAIYADQVDDAVVQDRLKEVQLAQADLAKVRYSGELAIRKILTADQLVQFRGLRQRFENVRREMVVRPRANGGRPGFEGQPIRNNDRPNRRLLKQNQQKPNQ